MKLAISIILAIIINLFLFLAIQKLVQPDHSAFELPELITTVNFIRLKKENKEPEPKLHEILPEKPKPPKKPPPPKQEIPDPEKPKPKKIKPPAPEVKPLLKITGGPHLGKYLKKPRPKKVIHKTAPTPEPEPVEEPDVAPVSEPVETVKETTDTGPVEPQEPEIETDVVPTYRSKPRYPPRALRAGIEGVVTVEFTITPKGTVTDPVIIKANPPKIFDKAVLRSIKRWKFKPKIVNGKPVSRRARQDIRFNLK